MRQNLGARHPGRWRFESNATLPNIASAGGCIRDLERVRTTRYTNRATETGFKCLQPLDNNIRKGKAQIGQSYKHMPRHMPYSNLDCEENVLALQNAYIDGAQHTRDGSMFLVCGREESVHQTMVN